MVEILVFSDSHGRGANIDEAISKQIKKPDAMLFLGDGLRDIDYIQNNDIPTYCVSGNCDIGILLSANAELEQIINIGGKKIFMTHGHRYGVKSTLSPLISEGVNKECDIVLYGHTHEPDAKMYDSDNDYGIKMNKPIYVMNPGSIGSYPYSFGVINIDNEGRILLSHGTLA